MPTNIADSLLDAFLGQDPHARPAIEVLLKGAEVVVAGEVSADASVDVEEIVRRAIREVGYVDPGEDFNADGVRITTWLSGQAAEIAQGVDTGPDQGAGDQGLMVGYATRETPGLMPLALALAHAVTARLAADRRAGVVSWLRPDGKAQVSVRYRDGRPDAVARVLVSTQHASDVSQDAVTEYVRDRLLPAALADWHAEDAEVLVNPTGSFVAGGPSADCGLTGRKTGRDVAAARSAGRTGASWCPLSRKGEGDRG